MRLRSPARMVFTQWYDEVDLKWALKARITCAAIVCGMEGCQKPTIGYDAFIRKWGANASKMQLVGFRTWEASGENELVNIDDAFWGIASAKRDFERQILISTWASLSACDKHFCQSMARGNVDARAIATDMGKKPNYVSKYKHRLLEQGVVEQDPYSRLSFAIPFFAEFVESTL